MSAPRPQRNPVTQGLSKLLPAKWLSLMDGKKQEFDLQQGVNETNDE